MVIVKITKNENKILNMLGFGTANAEVYDFYADKAAVTPLRQTQETEAPNALNVLKKFVSALQGESEQFQVLATLRPGQEAEVQVQPGTHEFYFKNSRTQDKSNELTINIDVNQDYVIEARIGLEGVTAGYSLSRPATNTTSATAGATVSAVAPSVVACRGCGALNKGRNAVCEYCGTPIKG
jgi:hypothetical protein